MRIRLIQRMIAAAGVSAMIGWAAGADGAMIRLPIDTQNSHISATVTEPLARMRDNPDTTGTFEIIAGEVDGDPDNLTATGHVSLDIDATSYDSGNSTRDRHVIHYALQTYNYTGIHFESTRIEDVKIVAAGAMGSATVVGNLTLHGVTREMSIPVDLSMSPDGIFDARGEVTFDYTDFGISPPRLLVLAAGKQVMVSFQIRAERPAAPSPSPTP
jgi:polyisoprenoid-binding protein YceI